MAAGAKVLPFPQRREPEHDDGEAPKSITALRKQFTNAVSAKWAENNEAAEAERYYNTVQWTKDELKTLEERKQPVVTFNRIKRKINVVCGILQKLKQEPKAFPRNPQRAADDGAEVATKTLKYAMGWDWSDRAAQAARRCAVRGIAGAELVTVQGDKGDPEISWDETDMRDFFYDPRSVKVDFSDARYLGTSRWVDLDEAQAAFPDAAEELADVVERGPAMDTERGDERGKIAWTSKPDKQVRIVDQWYMDGSKWYYCIYTGNLRLEHGPTPYFDEKGNPVHKFEMFSCEVDQDGDRYAYFRDWKGPQDEINHRRSKALHQLNSRKVIAEEGAVDDVDAARREYARADGWVVRNPGKEIATEDAQAAQVVQGNLEMLQEAKAEIDTYGPNPGLVGTEIPAESGRAIQLLQAAGIAELGGFVLAWKNWKLRCYRKTWNTIQKYWTSERFVRVTDDDNLAQFIQVNGWEQDPQTGQVLPLNHLAALDVDILIGEDNTDGVDMQADTLETLVAMAKGGIQIPPAAIIELSPLPSSVKQRVLMEIAKASQPSPIQQQEMMLKLQGMEAQIAELQSKAMLNQAKAAAEGVPDGQQQVDTPADLAKARLDMAKAAEIEQRVANPDHEPTQPGLWELNQAKTAESYAKANKAHADAEAAQIGAQMSLEQGRAGIDKIYGDQDIARQDADTRQLAAVTGADRGFQDSDTKRRQADHSAEVGRQDAQTRARVADATARKTGLEADTIQQAPPGMLTKPPPRPPGGAGKK
jgi:hypothetical protein